MTRLPYRDSKCNPVEAQQRIRKTLLKFGVDRIIFDEDFKNFTIFVKFQYKNYPVSIPLNYAEVAKRYQKEDPYNPSRRRINRDEWEKRHLETAYKASFSILNDFIKSMITIVEIGAFSFEEIFFSCFQGANGQRMGEIIKKELPNIIAGRFALGPGEPPAGIYLSMATADSKLQRGQVWCHKCGRTQRVNSSECLRSGWPECCGQTMSIDSPEERGKS